MKAQLTFDLPEEESEFQYAINGVKYSIALSEFDMVLRAHQKHGGNPEWDTATVDKIRELLHRIMADNGVD